MRGSERTFGYISTYLAVTSRFQMSSGKSSYTAKAEASGLTPRGQARSRSEEHTSELQSHSDLVCRLLLEKKKHQFSRAIYRRPCVRNDTGEGHSEQHPARFT